jgi:hypothetical protein
VKLIELKKRNETIASVCVVPHEDVTDEDTDEEPENLIDGNTDPVTE